MMVLLLIGIAVAMFVVEHLWPANDLPRVENWWGRVLLVNLIQGAIVIVAGITWDRSMAGVSLLGLREHLGLFPSVVIGYVVVTFIYYWWHRLRHESHWFWLLCHQLHHSPRRIEIFTSFYKHPVEITLNGLLSSAIVYLLLGCSVPAAALITFSTAVAEYIYHWNIKSPFWVGYLFQRPESHRIHHKYQHHTQNFGDLPIWDILFGTFHNPKKPVPECGFDAEKEDRFECMLAFKDVHSEKVLKSSPLHFLPTCIGCTKRWACYEANKGNESSQDTPE